jgi:hypothetical protein
MSWPLLGIQGRSVDEIGAILDDIRNRFGVGIAEIDTKAYAQEMEEAESKVVYKSLTVELVTEDSGLQFDIQNTGNVDLELLMFEVYVPRLILSGNTSLPHNADVRNVQRSGIDYAAIACYSNRGVCGGYAVMLRPIITPSMGKIRPKFAIPLRRDIDKAYRDWPVYYQIHALGYRTEEEQCKVSDIASWVRS